MDNILLEKLVNEKIQTTYAKIITYSFDEKPLSSIEGRVSGGSIQANGASAVRRTLSLSMIAKPEIANIENLDNEIAINKKVKVYIGRLVGDEIMWFNCGFYVISSASVNQSTSGWTISISGKDKMALLDGTAGGTLPTAVTFHEIFEDLGDGDYKIDYPTIYQIIQEAVNHYGEIPLHDIIINDLDKVAKVLIKYIGGKPIYFADNYASFSYTEDAVHTQKYTYGQDVGYEFTAFTYPGELVLAAGATVVNLLEKICQILGNYEYFFDLDGRFIFQEKKNYLNTVSPIAYLVPQDYIQSYSTEAAYEIKDSDTLVSLTRSPRYEDIKNDFVVWGKNASGVDIHYRLVIDEKPVLNKCKKYMWSVVDTAGDVINYLYTDTNTKPDGAKELVASPCEEWREEIYRNALERQAQVQSTEPYDAEMLAFWRLLYDPDNKDWVYADYPEYNHWNPSVREDPASLIFWIDFIDTTSEVGKYAVAQIGRRMKVVNNDNIKILFTKQIPPIVFIPDYQEVANLLEIEAPALKFTGTLTGATSCLGNNHGFATFSWRDATQKGYSSNGTDWTPPRIPYGFDVVGCSNTRMVAVNNVERRSYYSDNGGVSWKIGSYNVGFNVLGITYCNDKFLGFTGSGSSFKIVYSYDGISWTITSDVLPSRWKNDWGSFAYGNGVYIARSNDSGFMYSTDGLSWESVSVPSVRPGTTSSCLWNKITYFKGKFIATAYGRDCVITSADGRNWEFVILPVKQYSQILVEYKDKLYSFDNGHASLVTEDGVTWTVWQDISYIKAAAVSQGKLLLINKDETYQCTSDMKNWVTANYAAAVREYCAANETNYLFQLSPQVESSFVHSSTGSSAFDEIRNLLYQYLIYNTTISISCLPRYWYEPNNMIYLENRENGIQGNYVITQYSLPLTYNGTMSITMTQALTRV